MAAGLQPTVRSTTRVETNDGTSGSRTHSSPRFELGRFAGLRIVPFSDSIRSDPAPPMGFEPTISTLTGWRALRAAPRGHNFAVENGSGGIRTLSISRSEREWSASCLPSQVSLPIASRVVRSSGREYPGWDSNPQAPGFKPGRSTDWRTWAPPIGGLASRRKPWDSNPQAARAATCFQDRPLIRPVGFRRPTAIIFSSGGWNRTSGLHVQSVASLPAATAPESFVPLGRSHSGRRIRTSTA
jgi:hypothetical protein